MSPTPSFPKIIKVTFTGAATNDPVTIINTTTGEKVTKDRTKGSLLRLESRTKTITFDLDNFTSGYSIGDIVTVSIGGTKAGTAALTITDAKTGPQEATVAATAVNTAVLNI